MFEGYPHGEGKQVVAGARGDGQGLRHARAAGDAARAGSVVGVAGRLHTGGRRRGPWRRPHPRASHRESLAGPARAGKLVSCYPEMISPDGFLAVSWLEPGPGSGQPPPPRLLAVWERASGRLVRTLKHDALRMLIPAFGADGRTLVGVVKGELQVRDLRTDTNVRRIPLSHFAWSLSPDGRWVAAPGSGCTITLWDLRQGKKPPRPAAPSPDEIERLWKDLADADASRGVPAVWRLIDAGDATLAVLGKRLAQPCRRPSLLRCSATWRAVPSRLARRPTNGCGSWANGSSRPCGRGCRRTRRSN